MELTTSLANQIYAKARTAAAPQPQADGGGMGASFVKLAETFAETLAAGEATAKAAMTGDADPHALVQALASTESAVQTVATVRDKVVEAYQEILRMPV